MELDLAEQDPSVLAYARFYGLCIDYASEPPRLPDTSTPSSESFQAGLVDLPTSHPFTDPADKLKKDRLTISNEAALLLKDIFSLQHSLAHSPLTIKTWRHTSRLKQEVPLLRSNAELDLHEFGSTEIPSLTGSNIPLAEVNEEHDEGLQWPSRYWDYPRLWEERVESEKWSVSKDVLFLLQDAVRDTWTPEDSEKITGESSNQKMVRTKKETLKMTNMP